MYFFGRSTPFSASNIPANITFKGVQFAFDGTRHQVVGDLLNLVEFTFTHVNSKDTASKATVDTFINKKGKVENFGDLFPRLGFDCVGLCWDGFTQFCLFF